MNKQTIALILVNLFLLAGCTQATPPEPTIAPTPSPLTPPQALISEIVVGDTGNNNYEFIELYNLGDSPLALQEFSLWYRLPTSDEDLLVYHWFNPALIPAHGHYLLVREGEDVGIMPNATFTQSLNTSGGGLLLRDSDGETVDVLGWGNAPELFTEGDPAAIPENGTSLERGPGGEAGNHQDTNDNKEDFQISVAPHPQNTGSDPTPFIEQLVRLQLQAPEIVEPGSDFNYLLSITNETDLTLENIVAELGLPNELVLRSLPDSIERQGSTLFWTVEKLDPREERTETLMVTTPWAYLDFPIEIFFARVGDSPQAYFSDPVRTRIEGGVIPIGTARGLVNAEVSVEGIATMYTGGSYAGSGNVKFYLEDETGGLQAYVVGGEGEVDVPIGAHVRVKGIIEVYRDSIEIVPSVPGEVEIISSSTDTEPPLTQASIRQAVYDTETLPGRLVQVEGNVTRVEEFSYSYEIDLIDDEGNLLTLYVDKLTEMSVEKIRLGYDYAATGILDLRDGSVLLYPRLQSDLQEIFPPALILETEAPNTILPGETFPVTLTATNHSQTTVKDVMITVTLPSESVVLETVNHGGSRSGEEISWLIPELNENGGSVSVSFEMSSTGIGDQISIDSQVVSSTEEVEISTVEPWRIFIGADLPIWAIQGTGSSSPYVLDEATTTGVVTGVFPALEGFFIQTTESDDDPATSEGLFILSGEREIPASLGDLVEIHGHIREIGQQTQIEISSTEDVHVLHRGLPMPASVELDPPSDDLQAQQYYEALEGMLVQVSETAVAISPTSSYGEYVVVLEDKGVDRIWQGSEAGYMIMVDDGSSEVHYDSSTLDYVIATGDLVTGLRGPLAYTYGRYKIEPLTVPEITSRRELPQPLSSLGEDEFSVMTWNVENLFDILVPHPTDTPLPRKAEYELALTKIANTILAAGTPTIVALQEVEHLGILEDLAAHELLSEFDYIPVLMEGTDSRGIDVGYLVRSDQATLLDVQQHPAPEGITSRPPLLIVVQVETSDGSIILNVINNHFTSMSGGELATEPRRSAQAAWNASLLEDVLAEDPDAHVLILGDLNSYYESKPIDILREAGLRHAFEILDPDERYTYIYQGASQVLDHILITQGLMDMLRRVEILHTNADYPPSDPGDESPLHKSDHDPVIATFGINP
jgi:endonuclease/exonuclease/phosphatase family metal-dependent hydrolase